MIVSIHQPNFLPWAGYFYKVAESDVFVFLDTVQYSKNSLINRNRIKTPQGPLWLTVPVSYRHPQSIREVEINNAADWRKKHLKTLEMNYRKSPCFEEIYPGIADVYRSEDWRNLSRLNIRLASHVLEYLEIPTRTVIASNLAVSGKSTELLVNIIKKLGGDTYLSGFGGAKYQDEDLFTRDGIELRYYDFKSPVYPQPWGEFEANLSIIDLLFNCGKESRKILLQG